MSPDFAQAARQLLGASGDGETPAERAERAALTCEQLARHLSRLLGETGVDLLLRRSIVIATAEFPWLATATSHPSTMPGLRGALAQQNPDTLTESFVAILTAFVGLLERLIGAGLVDRLLAELWPAVFLHAAKDTP